MEIISQSLAETEQAAADFLDHLIKQPFGKGAIVVGLEGDLGAGKTTFVQAIGRALGIKDRMASPTFVLIKNYQIQCQGFPLPNKKGESLHPSLKDSPCHWRRLAHIDCYRLDKADDLLRLGWNEIAVDKNNLIFVEWPERVGDLLSKSDLKIKFEVIGDDSRKIIYG